MEKADTTQDLQVLKDLFMVPNKEALLDLLLEFKQELWQHLCGGGSPECPFGLFLGFAKLFRVNDQ